MWQEILIVLTGLFVIGYIVRKIMNAFKRKDTSPCSGCSIGCSLKDTEDAFKEICDKNKK